MFKYLRLSIIILSLVNNHSYMKILFIIHLKNNTNLKIKIEVTKIQY